MKWFIGFAFCFFCVTCDTYKDQPELKIAKDFVDAYFVFADQQKALKMSMGKATHLLDEELASLKMFGSRANAYRSRDVLFTLKKEKLFADEAVFLFELDIVIPQLPKRKLLVTVTVDRRDLKVKDFKEVF